MSEKPVIKVSPLNPALLGKKIGMTRIYDFKGRIVPVTVIQAGPCAITQIKCEHGKDEYNAIQLGFEDVKPKHSTQALMGHAAKSLTSPKRHFAEIEQASSRLEAKVRSPEKEKAKAEEKAKAAAEKAAEAPVEVKPGAKAEEKKPEEKNYEVEMKEIQLGDHLDVVIFDEVQFVDVIGVSKGKGFAGVMKRHHFGGQCASHGTERKHRSPGSIASRATWRGQCGKPKKGVRMAGHMGVDQVTTRNHPLVRIDVENNLLLVKGAMPGPNGGLLYVRKSKTARIPKPVAEKKK